MENIIFKAVYYIGYLAIPVAISFALSLLLPKKKRKVSFVVSLVSILALLSFGRSSYAATPETVAKNFSDNLVRNLPMRMNQQAVMNSAYSVGNQVRIIIQFEVTEQKFISEVGDITRVKRNMLAITRNSACSDPTTKSLINDYGVDFVYQYNFIDGNPLDKFFVGSCQ